MKWQTNLNHRKNPKQGYDKKLGGSGPTQSIIKHSKGWLMAPIGINGAGLITWSGLSSGSVNWQE